MRCPCTSIVQSSARHCHSLHHQGLESTLSASDASNAHSFIYPRTAHFHTVKLSAPTKRDASYLHSTTMRLSVAALALFASLTVAMPIAHHARNNAGDLANRSENTPGSLVERAMEFFEEERQRHAVECCEFCMVKDGLMECKFCVSFFTLAVETVADENAVRVLKRSLLRGSHVNVHRRSTRRNSFTGLYTPAVYVVDIGLNTSILGFTSEASHLPRTWSLILLQFRGRRLTRTGAH